MQQSQDRVYSYPKSLCDCYQCTTNKYKFPKGPPTNLAVPDCEISDYFSCYDRQLISESKQPQNKHGIAVINPQVYQEHYSPHFSKIECKRGTCDCCPKTQFASWDPRTWSATRNQYLTFDRPPVEGNVQLADIYDKKWKGYGQCYNTYSDINAGQITYYIDKSREDAYYSPNFTEPAVKVTKVVYKDPMGAMKPEYQRYVPYKDPISDDTCDYDPYCLSFIKDTQMHRDDILTGILVKNNQQRWEPMWT